MAGIAGGVRLSLSLRPSLHYKNKKNGCTLHKSQGDFYAHKIEYSSEESNLVQKHCSLPITSHLERHVQIIKHRRKEKTMFSCSCPRILPSTSSSSSTPTKEISHFPISTTKLYQNQTHLLHPRPLRATLNSPKGFGPSSKKTKKTQKLKKGFGNDDDDDDDDGDDDEEEVREEGVIPEIVTNRMISRMGLSVGIPLFIGLSFFPFFYYLKVGLKIDVPTWVPFIVSLFLFGTALLGVSYGIVSSSWDPMREGSLLGWNEAKKNWPVFWQSIWGRSAKN